MSRVFATRRCLSVLLWTLCGVLVSAENSSAQTPKVDSQALVSLAPTLSPQVAELALRAATCAHVKRGEAPPEKLAVIDYSRPSSEKRFWLFDLKTPNLLAEELVAHGKNTGLNEARTFSNLPGSLQSSLGLFRIGKNYIGKHGDSLRLIGLEAGINDLAEDRTIVLHGADYVSEEFLRLHQRLGRSFGCPALRKEAATEVIKLFAQSNGYLFSYYPDEEWLRTSDLLLNCAKM